VNSFNLSVLKSWSLDLSILQNYFGWYFIISGNLCYNFARLFLQHFLYCLNASKAGGLLLPYSLLVYLQCDFAILQSLSNHGARCFSHLFGFMLSIMIFFDTTPAATASSIMSSSIFYALISFDAACCLSTASNFYWNSSVVVCARHFCALVL
jgi:hypothetical protein